MFFRIEFWHVLGGLFFIGFYISTWYELIFNAFYSDFVEQINKHLVQTNWRFCICHRQAKFVQK